MAAIARKLLYLTLLSRWPWLLLAGYAALAFAPWAVIAVVATLLYGLYKQNQLPNVRFSHLMGSARLATLEDVVNAGAVGPGGVPLGVMPAPTFREAARILRTAAPGANRHACRVFWAWLRKRPVPVGLTRAVNVALFASVGAGKSTAFTIVWLLQNLGVSAVVLDPSGEQYRATARVRRRAGQTIVLLDPFGVIGGESDALNPIGDLSWHDILLLDNSRQMAVAIVVVTGSEKDPHWNESASVVITAAIVFQVALADSLDDPAVQTLGQVFALIADGPRLDAAMRALTASTAHDGTVAALGHQVLGFLGEERASVMSSSLRHLAWVNTPVTKAITAHSTFDPAMLRTRRVTVYLVMPPTALAEKKGLIRSWLTCFLRAGVAAGADTAARVQFVLDEYAALGRMDVIESALTQMRKYGVRLFFAFQSVKQLERCFPDGGADVLLGNVTQIYLGIQDYATADLTSKQAGRETATSYTFSGGTSDSYSYGLEGAKTGNYGSNSNWSATAHQRELFQPEEILQLGPGLALTFTPDLPPLLTRPVKFFDQEYRTVCRRPASGFALLVRSLLVFTLAWGLLVCATLVVVPATNAEFERLRARPATAPHPTLDRLGVQPTPPEWVVDGLGNVVTDRSGTPLRVPPGHHTEIDPRTLKVWVIPNGQRMFRLERTGPMNETGGSHRQPGLLAEAKAWFREGRNDLANAILKAFPDCMTLGREVGAPGTPTQGEIFQDRMGHGLDAASDVVALTPAPAPDQQQHNTRHRSGRG